MKPEMHDGWGMHDPRQEATGDREAYLPRGCDPSLRAFTFPPNPTKHHLICVAGFILHLGSASPSTAAFKHLPEVQAP